MPKSQIQLYLGEIVLAVIGLVTLIASLFIGINQPAGIVLAVITACAWVVSANAVSMDYRFRRTMIDVKHGTAGITTLQPENIYRVARSIIEKSTLVKATFFTDYMWKLQPGERGYETQSSEWGLTPSQVADFNSYFDILRDRLNKGEMQYFWITYINNDTKYFALIDRIKTGVSNNPVAARLGRISIHVLPHSVSIKDDKIEASLPVSQIGLQICQLSEHQELMIGPMRGRADPAVSLHIIGNEADTIQVVTAFEGWFDLLRSQCLPILDDGIINLNNVKHIGRIVGIAGETIQKETQEIEQLLKKYNLNEA